MCLKSYTTKENCAIRIFSMFPTEITKLNLIDHESGFV